MLTKALIVYATWTGNSMEIAEYLAESLKKLQVEVELVECQQIDPVAFLSVDICVVSTYTYGSEGNLPDEIVEFYDELGELDLKGKVFGTLGSGEKIYGYYCKSVDDFDKQFLASGAIRGAKVVKVELSPNKVDKERIVNFANELVRVHKLVKNKQE